MDIVYIDPGYGAGIDGVTCVENEEYNPINGVAYTIAKSNGGNLALPVPSGVLSLTTINQVKVVTVRFSVYLDLYSSNTFYVRFAGKKTYSFNFTSSSNGFHNVAFSRYAKVQVNQSPEFIYKTIRDIDSNISEADQITHASNEVPVSTILSSAFGNSIAFHIPPPDSSKCYVSNVMVTVGTEALSSGSFPVKLPLKNTSGDFISLGGGYCVGTACGSG